MGFLQYWESEQPRYKKGETYAVNNLMAESIEDYVTEIGVRIIS